MGARARVWHDAWLARGDVTKPTPTQRQARAEQLIRQLERAGVTVTTRDGRVQFRGYVEQAVAVELALVGTAALQDAYERIHPNVRRA